MKLTKKSIIHVSRKECWILWPVLKHTPLFYQNRYITKCKDQAELFNTFFANQCSLINNSSVLLSLLFKRTENVISSIDFGSDDIAKIIYSLDPNKSHGHDMISIRMFKICSNSIYKPSLVNFPILYWKREIPIWVEKS